MLTKGQITLMALRLNFSFCQMGMIILRINWLVLSCSLEFCIKKSMVMIEMAHSVNYLPVSIINFHADQELFITLW